MKARVNENILDKTPLVMKMFPLNTDLTLFTAKSQFHCTTHSVTGRDHKSLGLAKFPELCVGSRRAAETRAGASVVVGTLPISWKTLPDPTTTTNRWKTHPHARPSPHAQPRRPLRHNTAVPLIDFQGLQAQVTDILPERSAV